MTRLACGIQCQPWRRGLGGLGEEGGTGGRGDPGVMPGYEIRYIKEGRCKERAGDSSSGQNLAHVLFFFFLTPIFFF